MRLTSRLSLCAFVTVAGCSGGGASMSGSSLQSVSAPTLPQVAMRTSSQGEVAIPQPQFRSSTADLLYIGNIGNNSITVYRHDVSGNTAPLYVISGSNTGLSAMGQLSGDAQGNLYVANGNAILVFAHGANGNVAPIRKITGPATGIHSVRALTVDASTGKLFVSDSYEGDGYLLRFAPNSNGNVAPFARSAPEQGFDSQMASDSTGQNVIGARVAPCCNDQLAGTYTYAKQFYNNGDVNALYGTESVFTSGLADDPSTKTYLISGSIPKANGPAYQGIIRLAEDTNGSAYNGHTLNPPPISDITSDTCGSQIALGYLRNIYVTHGTQSSCPTDAVYVYTHDSSGNVPPLRVLTGPATKMNQPYGIYESL